LYLANMPAIWVFDIGQTLEITLIPRLAKL
jgi:hypothetical protein